MYKVFFNDSTIRISSEIKKSSNNNIVQIDGDESYDFVNQIVSEIELRGKPSDFLILHQDVNQLWDHFRSRFVEIPAAGGLVQNKDKLLLFIRRLGVWDLPKGKLNKAEKPKKGAKKVTTFEMTTTPQVEVIKVKGKKPGQFPEEEE